MIFGLYTHTHRTFKRKPRHLVGDGVGAWRGAGDVVESVGHGGVLHDVTGMDDVWARGWDLDLDLVAGAGWLGEQAHPGEQLGDFLSWLADEKKQTHTCCSLKRCELEDMSHQLKIKSPETLEKCQTTVKVTTLSLIRTDLFPSGTQNLSTSFPLI